MADLRPRSLVGKGLGPRYLVVEFASADEALAGARALVALGCSTVESFTPYSVPELEAALAVRRSRIPFGVFVLAITGFTLAFLLLWWTAAVDYPLDIGGRPLNSLPAHVPILFETTVLFSGVSGFLAVIFRSRLPRLYHPVFEIDGFERTTVDRYWLGVDGDEAKFDDEAASAMRGLGAVAIREHIPVKRDEAGEVRP